MEDKLVAKLRKEKEDEMDEESSSEGEIFEVKKGLLEAPQLAYLTKNFRSKWRGTFYLGSVHNEIGVDDSSTLTKEKIKGVISDTFKRFKLHRWMHVREITFKNIFSELIDNDVTRYSTALISSSLPNLTHLKIYFGMITCQQLESFGMMIGRHFSKLEQLTIKFPRDVSLFSGSFEITMNEMSTHLLSLKRLKLVFIGMYSENPPAKLVSDKGQHFEELVFMPCLYLTNLQHLTLSFDEMRIISDKGLEILGQKIAKKGSQLHYLKLLFKRCREITDKGLEMLMPKIARHLTSLKKLKLDFYGCLVTGHGFKLDCNMESLTYLDIQFEQFEEADTAGVSTVFSQISKHLPNLKSLKICYPKIKEDCLEVVGMSLTQLVCLEYLNLNFAKSEQITDKGLKALAPKIARYLTNLVHLELNFSSCLTITDKGFEAIGYEIATCLTQLQTLRLAFYNCNFLSESARNEVKEALSFIPALYI